MSAKYGVGATNQCFLKINHIFVKTLEAVQKHFVGDKANGFELYGFDIILNSQL